MVKSIQTLHISSQINDKSSDFDRIFILPKRTDVCLSGKQKILIRSYNAVSEPVVLLAFKISEKEDSGLQIDFSDTDRQNTAVLFIQSTDLGLRFDISVQAREPVWLIEWQLTGFDFDEIIIPALGGQSISNDMPEETTLSFKYPFWWNAQFAIGMKENSGLYIYSRETDPNLKFLRIGRNNGRFEISYGFEAQAVEKSNSLQATWFMDGFEGDWKIAVNRHREWMEKAFQLQPLSNNSFFPRWMEKINFILEIWGARKDWNEPLHTYPQMEKRLQEFSQMHDPEQTLIYLAGFAEHGIDSNAPDYNPGSLMGGEAQFKSLVDRAHSLGYRVMIHTNILAMTLHHRLYAEFQKYQVIDAFGRPQYWGLDIDGDWLTEPYFAYINPGFEEWSELMIRVIGQLIDKFSVDAVFLDQTLLAFNVSRGPNFLQGMRDHIKRLQRAFPNILFAGEGMHEHIVNPLPVAQIHGIDSIAEVHGLEGNMLWRKAHPVSTYLFGKYVKFTAHLLTKHPSNPLFEFQEDAYRQLGILPALCLYNYRQKMDLPAVKKMIKRAKKLTENS
ncbi:hypothetical protein JXQ31_15430 [candidate division KSB1 bacterium]|nr:hypothetical protein [candidate division KSB1 bacterium]